MLALSLSCTVLILTALWYNVYTYITGAQQCAVQTYTVDMEWISREWM